MAKLRNNITITNNDRILFNANTGDSFMINKVGKFIITLMQQDLTTEDIANEIVKNFDTNIARAKADLEDFYLLLKTYDLLENE